MRLFLVLRFGIATAFLGAALTFIVHAVKSWNNTPSVTSGELILESQLQCFGFSLENSKQAPLSFLESIL